MSDLVLHLMSSARLAMTGVMVLLMKASVLSRYSESSPRYGYLWESMLIEFFSNLPQDTLETYLSSMESLSPILRQKVMAWNLANSRMTSSACALSRPSASSLPAAYVKPFGQKWVSVDSVVVWIFLI